MFSRVFLGHTLAQKVCDYNCCLPDRPTGPPPGHAHAYTYQAPYCYSPKIRIRIRIQIFRSQFEIPSQESQEPLGSCQTFVSLFVCLATVLHSGKHPRIFMWICEHYPFVCVLCVLCVLAQNGSHSSIVRPTNFYVIQVPNNVTGNFQWIPLATCDCPSLVVKGERWREVAKSAPQNGTQAEPHNYWEALLSASSRLKWAAAP